jgi:hypothetical protein
MGGTLAGASSTAPKTPTGRLSQAGFSARYPKLNLGHPDQFAQAVRNIQSVHDITPPHIRQAGEEWYPKVHEAVAKGVRRTGISRRHGAGMVAAVSPQMDWGSRNIPAFKELTSLKPHEWEAIHRSAASGRRIPEVEHMLKGRSIAHASDTGLVRAHRLMQGEDPEDVLPRQTSPKTHSFYTNIHRPGDPGHVTIDYRAHDVAANRMYPAAFTGRGISSAALPSGKPTRYEHFEEAYRQAAHGLGLHLPHALQAITWEGGKHIETSAPTKTGAPRTKGVTRKGQPYFEE